MGPALACLGILGRLLLPLSFELLTCKTGIMPLTLQGGGREIKLDPLYKAVNEVPGT